ncbi:hypothetical protein R3P38DRAFT_3276417 [Favolaschia claudopus]|uniref:Uncharacterized protein n=2 Tax=Favolaschia claudopus TaxID=2862362 RepID=A0AAV9ZIQ7_9AGAR
MLPDSPGYYTMDSATWSAIQIHDLSSLMVSNSINLNLKSRNSETRWAYLLPRDFTLHQWIRRERDPDQHLRLQKLLALVNLVDNSLSDQIAVIKFSTNDPLFVYAGRGRDFNGMLDWISRRAVHRVATEAASYASHPAAFRLERGLRHFVGIIHFTCEGWVAEAYDSDDDEIPDLIPI